MGEAAVLDRPQEKPRAGAASRGRGVQRDLLLLQGPRRALLRVDECVRDRPQQVAREGAPRDAAPHLGDALLHGELQYLRLTADLYPDITAKMQQKFGDVIPLSGGDDCETN